MQKIHLIAVLFLWFTAGSCDTSKNQENSDINGLKEWTLVWSDEFDDGGLPDPEKWAYDVGDGCPDICGWGNNEMQFYTRDSLKNARVENGRLIIEVHQEKIGENDYTSARLVTRGRQDWTYGRFEIRAKLPTSRGVWSAIWMLPTDRTVYGPWPKCGEIDIMENVGYDPDTVEASAHTGSYYFTVGTQKHNRIAVPDSDKIFHDYVLEWEEDEYRIFVDDTCYFTFKNEGTGFMEWPFDQPFYLILNIAYGGNWGAARGIAPEKLPQRMEIDYVRVYQRKTKI